MRSSKRSVERQRTRFIPPNIALVRRVRSARTAMIGTELLGRFLICNRAATSIEYAIIVSLLALAILSSVNLVGAELQAIFGRLIDSPPPPIPPASDEPGPPPQPL